MNDDDLTGWLEFIRPSYRNLIRDPGDAEMDEPGDFEDYDPEDGSIINNRISSDRSEL